MPIIDGYNRTTIELHFSDSTPHTSTSISVTIEPTETDQLDITSKCAINLILIKGRTACYCQQQISCGR